jgi:hypothetical protein
MNVCRKVRLPIGREKKGRGNKVKRERNTIFRGIEFFNRKGTKGLGRENREISKRKN